MANTVSIFSIGFLRSYIITMRPYLLFISGITGLAGMSFAAEISNIEAVVLFLAFFLSYGFGQALTDCSQTDTDSISSPFRPLVKGLINRNDVLIVSLSGLVTCSIVFIYFSIINLFFTILAVIGLATYTYFKRKWWSGPFYNAWIVAVLFFIGYNSGLKNNSIYISNSIAAVMLAVFFGYANFVLTGYFKDVNADRQTGYNTLLVKFGFRISSIVSHLFALLFIFGAGAFIYFSVNFQSLKELIFAALFFITGLITTILAQKKLSKVKDEAAAYKAISLVVHSYILILSAITVLNKPTWLLLLIVFYLGFQLSMKSRPVQNQI